MRSKLFVYGISGFLLLTGLVCFAPSIHRLRDVFADAFEHRYDRVVDIGYRVGKGEVVSDEEYHHMMNEVNDAYPSWPIMTEKLKQKGLTEEQIEKIRQPTKLKIVRQ